MKKKLRPKRRFGGKIIAGGYFRNFNGSSANRIVRLQPNGQIDSSFATGSGLTSEPNANSPQANIVKLQPDGGIVVGGDFGFVSGVARHNIARLRPEGSLDTNFDPGAGTNSTVSDVALQADGKVLIAGNFMTVDGTSRPSIARLNGGPLSPPPPSPTPPTRLGNIATRLPVQTGDNALIAGFIVTGTQPKKIIVRGIGPSLSFSGTLANPMLQLHDSSGQLLEFNDDWVHSPNKQAIVDGTIPPANDLESAIVRVVPPSGAGYTAILRGVNNGVGIGVIEVYDLDGEDESQLANISTRGFVQTGDNVLFAGMIVIGQASQKVIVRGIGPSLSIPGKMANPMLELRDGNGTLLEGNDNWQESPNKQAIIDSTIPPTDPLESAITRILSPGNYTAILRGVTDTTGIAVVEVYALD